MPEVLTDSVPVALPLILNLELFLRSNIIYSSISMITNAFISKRTETFLFAALGCPDPDTKIYGWWKKSGQNATIGCSESSPEMWHVTCHGTRWIGHMGNCSSWGGTEGGSSTLFHR